MQIEEGEDDEAYESGYWFCCCCCKQEIINPDFNKYEHHFGWYQKATNIETGYLIPAAKKEWNGKTLKMLRDSNPVTKMLPSPEESIEKSNSKKSLNVDLSTPNFGMNVSDVNNLLRRRLSLSLHVSEEDQTGEKGEAIFPQVSTFSEAAPIILSHLVKDSSLESKRRSQMTLDSSSETSRKSSLKVDIEKFRASKGNDLTKMNSMQQKSDSDFLDSLMKTSNFMKEALEKDWSKTKNYVKWVDHYVNSSKYLEKVKS